MRILDVDNGALGNHVRWIVSPSLASRHLGYLPRTSLNLLKSPPQPIQTVFRMHGLSFLYFAVYRRTPEYASHTVPGIDSRLLCDTPKSPSHPRNTIHSSINQSLSLDLNAPNQLPKPLRRSRQFQQPKLPPPPLPPPFLNR